jgi:putative Mg2+ transporter-C (MgtC) family protein
MDGLFLTATHTPFTQILVRLVLACIFGAAIGIDREVRNQPAGLRTHMLTALAAAVFTIIALEIYHLVRSADDKVSADPIRAIEAVTAGVAFLAAGGIFRSRGGIRGLTTGAAMWLAGAMGVACGVGYLQVALAASVLALVILIFLGLLERYLPSLDGEKPRSSGT